MAQYNYSFICCWGFDSYFGLYFYFYVNFLQLPSNVWLIRQLCYIFVPTCPTWPLSQELHKQQPPALSVLNGHTQVWRAFSNLMKLNFLIRKFQDEHHCQNYQLPLGTEPQAGFKVSCNKKSNELIVLAAKHQCEALDSMMISNLQIKAILLADCGFRQCT